MIGDASNSDNKRDSHPSIELLAPEGEDPPETGMLSSKKYSGMFLKARQLLFMAFADRTKEERFLSQHRDGTAEHLRWACLVGAAIIIGFMWQDTLISANGQQAIYIRIFGALPVSALAWYLSRKPGVRRYISLISAFFWFSYSCFIAAIFIIYEPGPYGLTSSIGLGSFLILLFGEFTFSNLPVGASLIVGLLTLLVYMVSVALWTEADFGNFIMGDFLTAVALVMGAATKTLFSERAQRRLFETSELLRQSCTMVEQQVRERTSELQVTNMKLSDEIAERKQVEESLRESEEKFRLTFNSSPDSVNINRLQDGLYIDVNDGFTQLTGFTHADVAGKTSLDINIWHDPADRETLVQALREKGVCDNLEARFKRKDGSLTTALMSARVISLKGEPHIISITRDISERKKTEAEREQLLLAIEQANEMVAITSASGVIQYVNPAFEKITEFSRRETIGETPRILKSDHHDRSFYKDLWETILAGNPWKGHLINKRKNGTLYTGECSISPVKDENGNVVNFVWISRDITSEVELEKRVSQAQKMEAIGALAGGIAHDFNNILYPIIGFSEMLMEDLPAGSPDHENVEVIFKAARRAGDLVKQILSFSRQTEHEKMPVRIQHILKEVLKLTRSTIPSSIDITQFIQTDCGLVMADPTQLHQIVMNLITNAYHAVEESGGSISVQLKETALSGEDWADTSLKPGQYAVMSITDNGCGIAPANMGKIFEPFFTTKDLGKGTGLGLSVVYGIVKDYGGDISVYSEVGKGTTFTVYLPIIKKDTDPISAEELIIFETGTERILLVDDEEPIVQLEKQMLERLGYQVEERTSSIEALKAFRTHPDAFDLVITDMNMPNMSGDKLATKLRSIKPGLPIIICTGFSVKIDSQKAKAIGVNGCLMKPVVKSEMAKMVRKVLDEAKEG